MRKIHIFPLMALLSLALVSCQRKADDESSISFSVPRSMPAFKQESMSSLNSESKFIVFNISGPGLLVPIVCSIDVERNEANGPCRFDPITFELKLIAPKGSDRLFQIAVVYKDSITEQLSFYYGERTQSISSSQEAVSIAINLAQSTSGDEGKVRGRFLTSNNSGPTGILEIKGKFGSLGSPAMTIFRKEIWDGWFEVMTLDGLKFQYLANGVELFGGPQDLASFKSIAANSGDLVRSRYEYDRDLIYGFFGPGASVGSQFVCTSANSPTICTSLHAANPSVEFASYLDLYSAAGTTASEFRGPFKKVPGGSGYIQIGSDTATAALLPGNFTGIIDGIRLIEFKPAFPNVDNFLSQFTLDDDEIDCDRLVPAARIAPLVSVYESNSDLITWSAVGIQATSKVLVCAHKNGRHFKTVVANFDYHQGGGGGGGSPTQFKYRVSEALASTRCMRGNIEILNSLGFNANVPVISNLNLTSDSSLTEFSPIPGAGSCTCTGGVLSLNIAIPAGQSNASFCYKTTESAGINKKIIGNFSGAFIANGVEAPFKVVTATGQMANLEVNSTNGSTMNSGTCRQISVQAKDGAGGNVTSENSNLVLALKSYDGSTISPVSAELFSLAGCNPVDSLGVGGNVSLSGGVQSIWVKGMSIGSYRLELSYTSAQSVAMFRDFYIQVVPVGAATNLAINNISGGIPAVSNNCLVFEVKAVDDASSPVAVSGNTFFNSSLGTGVSEVFSDANCLSQISSTALNNGNAIIYVKNQHQTGTAQFMNLSASYINGSQSLFGNISSVSILPLAVHSTRAGGGILRDPTCEAITFYLKDSPGGGSLVSNQSGQPVTIMPLLSGGAVFGTHYQIYSESSCSAATSAVVFPPGSSQQTVYIKSLVNAIPAGVTGGSLITNVLPFSTTGNVAVFTQLCQATGGSSLCL